MKKISVLFLFATLAMPLAACADTNANQQRVNYYTPYFNQGNIIQGKQVQYAEKNSKVYKKSSGNDYILKYNIDDLESAPWVNGGKRKI